MTRSCTEAEAITNEETNSLYGGGRLDSRGGFNGPIGFATGVLPPDAPRWGAGMKEALKQFPNTVSVAAFCTSLPLETNNISLDPDLKDDWGLPAMRVACKDHPDGMKTKQFFTDRAMEILQAAGEHNTWPTPVSETTGGGHLMGTCRMGNDPRTSVVDKFHKAHDVPNV